MFVLDDNILDATQNGYFSWLVESVCLDRDPYFGQPYWRLARLLHYTPFYVTHPMDQNRVADGLRLRETWLDLMTSEAEELGRPLDICPESLDRPCSVLEVLVGLATRLEDDIMQNEKYGNRTPMWFWAMIYNLELTGCMDSRLGMNENSYAAERLDIWMNRAYEPNGLGGVFPLNDPDKDQRDVELWLQARAWLNENYPE